MHLANRPSTGRTLLQFCSIGSLLNPQSSWIRIRICESVVLHGIRLPSSQIPQSSISRVYRGSRFLPASIPTSDDYCAIDVFLVFNYRRISASCQNALHCWHRNVSPPTILPVTSVQYHFGPNLNRISMYNVQRTTSRFQFC